MKKILLGVATLLATLSTKAIDNNVVAITYSGNTATIEIASNITNYVSCTSGTSSHVKLVQNSTSSANPGEIIYQLSGTSDNGEFYMEGEKVRFKHPRDAIRKGLAYVSEDRKGNGLILMQDIRYNISLANLEELVDRISINENEEINIANDYKNSINIKAPSIEQKVGNLSGGNQQKVQIAKWMFAKPKVLILDEPTRGIDVGAKFEIYSLMNKLVDQGMSIIMISSELPEVLGMSDRLYVMSEGTITGELTAEEATEEKVMAMAIKGN